MSILIWGRRQKTLALAAAGERRCERCGLPRPHTFVVDYTLNHLYYIFGFVSGRRVACRCAVCGLATAEALDPAMDLRGRTAIAPLERFGCLGLGLAVAGLGLVAIAWSVFGTQPRNIPDLMARVQRGESAALARLEAEATGGDVPSQLALVQIYRDGLGVPADPGRGFDWATRAAKGGSPAAQFELGAMYEWGRGTVADPARAAVWYRKAEASGVAAAANSLGALYLRGIGVGADPAAAAVWFRQAAEAGDLPGQFNLAMRYLDGQGVTADPAEARRWLERAAAASAGDPTSRTVVANAQMQLGAIYEEGSGVERDAVKALHLYELASPLNEDARASFARLRARLDG